MVELLLGREAADHNSQLNMAELGKLVRRRRFVRLRH